MFLLAKWANSIATLDLNLFYNIEISHIAINIK